MTGAARPGVVDTIVAPCTAAGAGARSAVRLSGPRAFELADQMGVLPINIALAYVLCQPFPTFPLIGPRTLNETWTSLPGLAVQLTPEQLKWLNLED